MTNMDFDRKNDIASLFRTASADALSKVFGDDAVTAGLARRALRQEVSAPDGIRTSVSSTSIIGCSRP